MYFTNIEKGFCNYSLALKTNDKILLITKTRKFFRVFKLKIVSNNRIITDYNRTVQ